MAMVKITNGSLTLVVTTGAFRSMFQPLGWHIEGEVHPVASPKAPESVPAPVVVKPTPEPHVEEEDDLEDSGEDSEDEEPEDEEEDYSERPLSSLNLEELLVYARRLGLEVTSLKTKAQVREAIKAVL